MEVLTYDNEILNKKSIDIEEIDNDIIKLAKKMHKFMIKSNGIGLAAPQIGISKRLIVIDTQEEGGVGQITMINPIIEDFSDIKATANEGCLSVPGIYAPVSRSKTIKVKYLNLEGTQMELTANDLLARVIQHEVDHLDGILFISKLQGKDSLKKIQPLLEKIKRGEKID